MGHLWLLGTWGFWGLLLCAADPRTDGSKIIPKVTEIIPKYGSINGATRLTIKGEGFAQANQFNYGVDEAELGNSVQLVSSFRSISCDVEKDASHSTQITCYTRAMPEDSYTVRVSVDGVPITENNTCRGHIHSRACRFYAKSFRTPTIRKITPLSGTPGTLITIQGRIFTDVYGSNTALSSNGKNVRILRVYIGGMPCELLIPQSDNLYGLKLDHPSGDMGSMICKTTGTYVGHHNVSFILDSDYGRSFPQKMAYFVSSLNKIAMFQTYAEVTTISPSQGSVQGGTTLTISGRFFDQTDFPVRVLVGGQACDVLNVTENSICCKTSPKPGILKTVHPGGRGLKLEVWNNSRPVHLEEILEYNEKTPGYMGASWVDSVSYIWPMEQDTFVARFSGFLVAPESDVYRFYIKGDDRYAIYFSQTGLPEDKMRIAYHSSSANSYFSSPTQRSDDIHLQKGKEYYMEILLQEYTLSASVDVGLYQYRNVYTEQQTEDAVNEEQVIQSQSTVVQEVQVITLENWETTIATKEVQRVMITSPCIEVNSCSLYQYRLIYNMEKTVLLPADASDFILQSALNDLWSLKPDTVQVTRTQNPHSFVYTITFVSTRGDFDLLDFEVFGGYNVTLDITEQTKGKPSLDTFTLNWDGITSKPLSPRSSETEFQAAVEEMVSTQCPPQVANFEEGFVVKYFRDYEMDFNLEHINRGQKTAETDAYCGRYSLKNPAVLFDSADVKPNRLPYGDILLFPYNQLCLAYKGFLANYIGLKFQYQDNNKITRITDTQFTYNFAYGNNWTYTCIDLLDLIQAKYSGTNFSLQRISVQRASKSQSFYVDVVYIGQTPTISVWDEMPKRRLPALANKGIFLKHFQVNQTKINGSNMKNKYSVTMTSYNCSYNIPMMAVSFGQIITNASENESVYRGSNWPGESRIRIQRIQAASSPLGGSFDIQAHGRILKGLPAAVSVADLRFALQSLEEVGLVSVTREGTCAGYSWNVKWKSACGKQNLLQINDSNIIGEKANMTVTKVKEGGLFRQRILGDLLRAPCQQPQVEVYVNGIPAKCSGDCGFTWDPMTTPIVQATSPSQGSYEERTILTISGSGFSPSSAVSVSVGPIDCSLLSVNENEIKCQILNGSAGHFPVAVSVADAGLARHVEGQVRHFTYRSRISHVWPASGSLAGGTLLTLSGSGFNENSKVLVGNETCNVIDGDLNKITCRTPKRIEGTVDISVITNGFQATAKDVYSYNCLQTPVITDFSPKVRTILGEVNLTIKGYNFGTELTRSVEVYVGGKRCQVLHWNFTDIRCLLPKLSPGRHDIYVEVTNWGFASTRDRLNASIQYILEVSKMFPQRGSLYGGTEITVMGLGFSTIPTENTVCIGFFPCSVTSSSSDVIKCTLSSTGNVFRITNDGEDSVHGLGYAWSPSVLNVSVGDTVTWYWQAHPFLRGIGYRVFSVSSPASVTYDGKGFMNGREKSAAGSFSYQFTSPGIHYYSSGYVDEAQSIFLQGVINVLPAETRQIPLHLFVGSTEATYTQGEPLNLHLGSSVAGCLATEPLCGLNNAGAKNSDRLLFELSRCSSPSINSISPSTGTVNDLITITGQGFSNLTCANKVTIGSYPCVVEESSTNSMVCHIDPQNSMDVGIRETVTVTVYNLGIAVNTLSNELDRRFVLLPNIDMVLPNAGSTTGMSKVTIKGSGFSVSSAAIEVLMGHFPCRVLSVNYTTIECETSPAPQQLVTIQVLIHGVPARCQGNCSFSYLESIAAFITRVSPNSIRGSVIVLIEGEGFGTILEDIAVFIGNQQFRAIDVHENNISVLVTPLPAGFHPVSVVVGSKGLALGNLSVSSPPVASVTPNSGSIGGGTTLVITGNGFYPGNTTVTVGDEPCRIISVNSSEVYCRTPAGTAGPVNVTVFVNVVAYPPLPFTYAAEDTPLLREVVPSTGPPGTKIQITGSNFGIDILEISVMINNIQCNVTMVNDTVLQCIVGDHAGGTFPVMMHHETKGSAVSTVVFEYPLAIQNIHPSQGSFGGGQTMTVTGTGFNPQNSKILVCGSECAVDGHKSDYTTLLCKIPPNNDGGPEQACEVSVVNGKDSSQSTTPFVYTMSLTPLVTETSPRRGSTAGGTRLTVTGSGFSENTQDVLVTIAEAKCDVEYSNKTCIICVTNAHTPSGWAPVHVAVGSVGMARRGNADFLYFDAWSSNFSWGGKPPPEEGSLVVITKGQTILLDQNTPILKMLLIQGGTLMFDEADIELQAENILITDGGTLQIGTEASPFQHKAVITLHGHLRSPELPVYGAKTLAVREGVLDLHGRPVPVVWTRLAHTAQAGERTLILQQAVTWKPGDKIVIASTGHRHSQRENEEKSVAAVSADGVTVTLASPLSYTHLGITVPLPDGTPFEARAEVGILTRNILIRGSDNVEWNNQIPACPDGFDAALGVTSITGVCNERCGGWSAKFVDIQYFDTPNKAGFRWEHEVVLIDVDGSLTGHKGHTVIPHSSLLDPSHCTQEAEWSVGFPGSVCDASVSFHRLAFNKPSPVSLLEKDVVLSDAFGTSIVPFQKKRLTHMSGWMALIPNAKHINWYFKGVDHVTNISYTSTFYGFKRHLDEVEVLCMAYGLWLTLISFILHSPSLMEEDYVIISHNFTQNPDMFNVVDMRNGSSNPLSWNTSKNGDWHLEPNTSTLYYLVSGRNDLPQSQPVSGTLDPDVKDVTINFQAYCCILQDCFPVHPPSRSPIPRKRPATYNLWSNDTFWQSSRENNYTIPHPGANVVIPEGTWVVADTDIPPMERLIIWGVLELEDKQNVEAAESSYRKVVLNATYISLQGGRLIGGWEDNPFKGELQIVLRGNHSTPEWAFSEGPNQGSKVLGVFGELDLHGIPRSIYKTKLSETANAGSKVLSLVDAVDWQEGEEIVITTTSYDIHQTETRSIVKIMHDHKILILNDTLSYTHLGERYHVPGTGQSYRLAADVGILSRNIKILGEDYPGWFKESFGARVLVSSFTENTMTFKGNARISNMEFYHSGQEGFRDSTDPRYAVTFLNLGQIQEHGSSYIRGCAFHHGFSPAIGVFGTDGLDIDDNIIHLTVGEGIRIWGDANRVRGNLVALSIWPGTYQNRKDFSSTLWHAAIEINRGTNTVLQNNVVAGFGRAGYRIDGEPCSIQSNPLEKWFDNEAHGGFYGIYMNQDGLPGCSLIQGFTIWMCWDYGIYFQTTESVYIHNVTLVDNGMAISSMIYMPAAISHQISSKTVKIKSSLIVGSSPEFNCSDVLTNDDPNIELSAAHRSSRPPSGGRSGICWPTFASAHNMAPRKPHAGIMSYNAISGLLEVSGSTFVGFKNVCSGETNVIFITNPLNEDLQHPVHVKNIQLVDTTEQSKIFIHRPDVRKVNPSDCVDMVCDAKRKSFLRDTDGSFLGTSGSVIPQSEYEWNGNSQFGIGDYRIPKVMLTFPNGSRIPVTEKAPYKGVIRDATCKYIPEWQSYKCSGMEYAMMVIESLDSDTETRRLSPVAIVSNGYVDLINGPQDHGWCAGYTCQRRLSLFHSIVALNKSYEVYFTGTSPQNLRLMLLNVDYDKAVLVGIFFPTLQRLDVYVNNALVCPKDTVWNSQQKHCELNRHLYTGQFLPNLNSTVFGENYFDRTYQMLYLLVKGTVPVEIHTTAVIFVSFQIPAITEDDFYSSHNLVRNLALFLKIPSDKIRISKIGGERLRKKRSMGFVVELEIGDPPPRFISNDTTGQMQLSELQEIAASLGQAVVLGKTSSTLGFNVSSMSITKPLPSPIDSGWSKVTAQPVERSAFPVHHVAFVSSLSVITQPVAVQLGQPFAQQPSVKAIDLDGNCVSVEITSLTLKAVLKDSNNNQISGLSGNTTIPFSSCWANYTDLTLLRTGKNYKIEFVLDDVARVESRAFSLPAQSVSGGGGGGGSGTASTGGTAAQIMAAVISCLMGRVLLLEIFMAAVLTLNVNLGSN
ncbi:fibrocystin-L isoform 14-T16 [Molossus nigricans]